MTKEEMARAYADGYNKEYQQIAYDAFLCGYGAKCESFVSEGLEEAAREYAKEYTKNEGNGGDDWEDDIQITFKAGAEWQKKQDQETIELAEDHAMLAGMNKMEQQMMEKAVECVVENWNEEPHPEITIPLNPEVFGVGDKVRVIVIKEDEK